VRTLVPALPLEGLVEQSVIKETALDDLRRFDHLINYLYLPPLEVDELEFSMPESVALLYMPVTLHHAFSRGSVSRSSPTPAHSSSSASSSGSTPAGLRTTLASSSRRWTSAVPKSRHLICGSEYGWVPGWRRRSARGAA
jgi:hypothetical protein